MKCVERIFKQARAYVGSRFPEVMGFQLYFGCPDCDALHRRSSRAYMHVEHYPGVVCCAKAARERSTASLWGLFLHEFGHIIGGPTQYDADWAIWQNFGIPIMYGEDEVQFVEMRR